MRVRHIAPRLGCVPVIDIGLRVATSTARARRMGHTNVRVRWGKLGGKHDKSGGQGFYHFTSDQQPTEYVLGRSAREALEWLSP